MAADILTETLTSAVEVGLGILGPLGGCTKLV